MHHSLEDQRRNDKAHEESTFGEARIERPHLQDDVLRCIRDRIRAQGGEGGQGVIPTPTKTKIRVYGTLAFSERICENSMTATNPVKTNSMVATAIVALAPGDQLSSRAGSAEGAISGHSFLPPAWSLSSLDQRESFTSRLVES